MRFERTACNILLIIFALAASCREDSVPGNKGVVGKPELEEMNVYLVRKDRERIISYIERRGLQMNESPTGLWYQVIREGDGSFFTENDHIRFNYECFLLDGTKCYSSDELGPKDIILGKSRLEAGLNEGLRLLKPGGEAIFIIPSYLAHGFVGDRNRIPPHAVVVYHINIF